MSVPRAPATLEEPERERWRQINSEVQFNSSELATLQMGLEALGEHRRCLELVAKEGLIIKSEGGLTRKHPATEVAKNARATWIAVVRALKLVTEEEPAKVGRPPGGRKRREKPYWASRG